MRTNAPEGLAASSATERARRASVEADDADAALPDPQVAAKPRRRRFTAEYKRRILKTADAVREPGEIGAILRREGLYSSHLSKWRAQRDQGVLNALAPRRRGRKPVLRSADRVRIAELERENEALRGQLQRAELIIDVQKKVANLLGVKPPDGKHEPNS